MNVNDYQIGGAHYSHQNYQHWDFAVDIAGNDAYLKGCASKYVVRYKEKNGIEDLRKAIHYLDKISEKGLFTSYLDGKNHGIIMEFVAQLEPMIAHIVVAIYSNDIELAKKYINELIEQVLDGKE